MCGNEKRKSKQKILAFFIHKVSEDIWVLQILGQTQQMVLVILLDLFVFWRSSSLSHLINIQNKSWKKIQEADSGKI